MASNTPHSTVQIPEGRPDIDEPTTGVTPVADKPGKGLRAAGRAVRWALVAGVVVVLIIVLGFVAAIGHLHNPFASKTTDRSQPVLLLSIKDLARFDAASGNFQVVVDIKHDHSYIPDFIDSERSLFVAAGSVEAYVDFSQLGPSAVVTSADRKTATITLPTPQLAPATLDVGHSYVYSEQKGLVNKLQDLFSNDPNGQKALYQAAQQKIAAAAVSSQLAQHAEVNTTAMLNELLKSLGFTSITVTYPAS